MNTNNLVKIVFLLLIITIGTTQAQDLKLASLFSNHMVLQRGQAVPVWGTAKPKERITVAFAGQRKVTKTGKDGKWMISLDSMQVSKQGRDMLISSGNESEVVISDVLVGEVWICSGQSNMKYEAKSVPEIKGLIPFAKNIRSFEVNRTVSFEEKDDVSGKWSTTHPSSAVAFSYAYFLENIADVPVGIIHSSWGSSSIEAWMPRDMTEKLPHFKTIMEDFDKDTITRNKITKILSSENGWSGKDDVFLRRQPNILYNAIMKPLAPYAVRGLVWYQGERNTRSFSAMPDDPETKWFHRVIGMKQYGEVLNQWILRYRKEWDNDRMNFMIVMLPGYGKGIFENPTIDPQDPEAPSWAWMRESQLKVLDLPNTAVVNTIDLGNVKNIHPNDKLPIGQRLALLAAKNTLGYDILSQGPKMKSVENQGDRLVVKFDYATGLKTTNGKAPSGFWLADQSGIWQKADAIIERETVILSAQGLEKPLYVRYAFAGKPKVNLVNQIELPAYPFRTDEWDEVSESKQ